MDEKDRIGAEDSKLAYQYAEAWGRLQDDKKQIEDWLEFHLYNGPTFHGFKTLKAKNLFNDMQLKLERLMYEYQEKVDKL